MPFTGVEWLLPKLKPFLEKHIKVKIKIILKNPLSLLPEEGDILISIPLSGSKKNYISKDLATITYGLYASVEYLKKYGTPCTLEELKNHQLITLGSATLISPGSRSWIMTIDNNQEKPVNPYFEINMPIGLFKAAKLGLGIAELPHMDTVTACTDLVNIFPNFNSSTAYIHYIFAKKKKNCPLIEELYDHLRLYISKANQ